MERVNVHIYPSPFKNESRILKITKTLADAKVFDKIYIIATWENGLPEIENIDNVREVVRIQGRSLEVKQGNFKKVLKTLQWSWNIFKFLRRKKVSCINCHSLQVLPLCVLLKIFKQSKLVYDTHELETEVAGYKGLFKYLAKVLEKILIRFVNETIVVSDSIAQWYQKEYRLDKVWVIKNVPYKYEGNIVKTKLLRDAAGIRDDQILFLYQGAISSERGIGLLLDIFSKLDNKKHIIFMGYGEMVGKVVENAKNYSNIHYHPAVKPDEVVSYTSSADIGVHLIANTCLNHYYCLPNKIWEYLNAGLPIIVSDLPEMSKVVDQYQCGWKCVPTISNAARVIEQITGDSISEKRKYAIAARNYFGWHLEEPTLLSVYKRLGF